MSAEAERWREAVLHHSVTAEAELVEAGDDLLAALKAERHWRRSNAADLEAVFLDLEAEREARRVERETVDAGLRNIADLGAVCTDPVARRMGVLARDLLAGRAAGGEG